VIDRICVINADGSTGYDWPLIEATAARWSPGVTDMICCMAKLLLPLRPVANKPLTDEQIEALAAPFVRQLGGDHWYSGEQGISDDSDITLFARAIEAMHGITRPKP